MMYYGYIWACMDRFSHTPLTLQVCEQFSSEARFAEYVKSHQRHLKTGQSTALRAILIKLDETNLDNPVEILVNLQETAPLRQRTVVNPKAVKKEETPEERRKRQQTAIEAMMATAVFHPMTTVQTNPTTIVPSPVIPEF